MGKRGSLSGGGIESRQVSNVNAPKQPVKPHGVSVGAVSRIGGMMPVGSDYKALYNQQAYTNPVGPIPVVGANCKPGGGRTCLPSGSQGKHGAAVSGTARPGASKPIFPKFS
jgi:hypothetical protein